MKTKSFEIIPIEWSEPLPFRELELQSYSNGGDRFLYQIYGHHSIYGSNVLLYIGRTNSPDRRIEEHAFFKFSRGLNLTVRIGEILDDVSDMNILNMAESLLIASFKPSYNSAQLMGDQHLNKSLFIVQNLGNRGSLPLECSNIWWMPEG